MKCLTCNLRPAQIDKHYGVLDCKECQQRQSKFAKPYQNVEFTSGEIKEGRKEYARSIIQKYRNGELSREYVEAYPERAKAMVKTGIHTEKEIKQARSVWSDVLPNWERSK